MGVNRFIREADAEYARHLAARAARQAEIDAQVGFHREEPQHFPGRNGRQRLTKARKARFRR